MTRVIGVLAGTVVSAALGYAGYVAVTWCRYGRTEPGPASSSDPLLDRFMPRSKCASAIRRACTRRRP